MDVFSKQGSTPTPWAQGLRDQYNNGRSRPRKPFISRVFCAQRPSETMVSEGARPWGRGRSGDCDEWVFSVFFLSQNIHAKIHTKIHTDFVNHFPTGFSGCSALVYVAALECPYFHVKKPRLAHSGPLRLRVQSRSRTRLRIAVSIAFCFALVLKGFRHYSTTITRLSSPSGLERGG